MNNTITWKEVSREYVISLNSESKAILIYNPYTNIYRYDNYYDSVYYNKAVLKFNELLNKEIEE